MTHYTLNTGHAVASPRSGVSREAIEALQPLIERGRPMPGYPSLIEQGGPIPGRAPWRVTIRRCTGGATFEVWRNSYPFFLGPEMIIECGLAWTAEGEAAVWPAVEKIYLGLSDEHPQLFAPAKESCKPASLPWLAVVVMPFITNQIREDVSWFGDFERCMAWTILEERSGLLG